MGGVKYMEEKFEYIPLEKIQVQKHNVRIHDIDQGIEELAQSIKSLGLLQPIAAYFNSKTSEYVILTGQRRLNAYHLLNKEYPGEVYDKIQCKIIPEPESDDKKKALSLAENITQNQMTNSDLIKAVTDLWNIYGDYEMVKEEFGITKKQVDTYVRLARLPDEVKTAIQNGEIHPNPKTAERISLKAVDALDFTVNGETPVRDVIELAKEMGKKENNPADLADEAKRGGTSQEIVKRAREKKKIKHQINLTLEHADKLERISESNGETPESRATQYVIDGVDKDYNELGD